MRYLSAHPDACDSLEGICDWWLARQRHDDAKSELAGALDDLLAGGRVEATTDAGGLTVYHAVRKLKRELQ